MPLHINPNCHGRDANKKKVGNFNRVTLEVKIILDPVKGPWSTPEDMVNFLMQHSYVDTVRTNLRVETPE